MWSLDGPIHAHGPRTDVGSRGKDARPRQARGTICHHVPMNIQEASRRGPGGRGSGARLRALAVVTSLAVAALAACSTTEKETAALVAAAPGPGPTCHPAIETNARHYMIGYGSLMQQVSRTQTAPSATEALPIEVQGFRRGFFAEGKAPGFDTVYLGVVPEASSRMNAVLFDVRADEIPDLDKREGIYCRVAVPSSQITVLGTGDTLPEGSAWIYVIKADSIGLPSDAKPIIQSYVDIFLSGCLELEQRRALRGFADDCVTSTTDWSNHWVNDRVFPRRPQYQQPLARSIDTLLKAHLPEQFAAIRIE